MSSVPATTIDLADPRTKRAIGLAADAGQWLKCVSSSDGKKAYGIRSSKCGSCSYYLTTRTSCTCPDQQFSPWRDCKHIVAVNIHVALASAA